MELTSRCIRALGPRAGNERDIEDLAWRHAAQGADIESRRSVEAFFTELTNVSNTTFTYLVPNYVVRFSEGEREISIGPVRASYTKDVSGRLKRENGDHIWNITTARSVRTKGQSGRKFKIALTPVCWEDSVRASGRNVSDEALWLIDVALNLLRLSYRPMPDPPRFPQIGD